MDKQHKAMELHLHKYNNNKIVDNPQFRSLNRYWVVLIGVVRPSYTS